MKRSLTLIAIFALFVALSASAATAQEEYSRSVPGDVSDAPWWTNIGDPILTDIIERGLAANPDLTAAKSLAKKYKAVAWQTLAPALPQISIELTGRETAIESLGANSIDQMEAQGEDVPDSYTSGSAYLVGKLDLDLFGKRILSHMGARADAAAALQDRDAYAASLAELIAQTYYGILAGRTRVNVVKTQIQANEDLLELVQLKYERGVAEGLDVLQQKQQLATTRTQIPYAQALLETYEQQLAVLLGMPPGQKIAIPDRKLPEAVAVSPTGLPEDLSLNQPTLKSAEASLNAERKRRLSAMVNFLPTIGLYAQTGEKFTDINEWEQDSVWEVGATISIPLFQGGSNLAGYKSARASEIIAKSQHRKATLEALRKVESAMISLEQARKQLEAYRQQQEAADQAFTQSKSRYLSGLSNYQTVLTALSTKQQAELNVVETKVSWVQAMIDVADSVGGSWTANLGETQGEDDQ